MYAETHAIPSCNLGEKLSPVLSVCFQVHTCLQSLQLKCCLMDNTGASQSRYFLAIDGGGTKAEFLLADDSAELARVRGGSIKILNISPEVAEANFIEA